MTDEEINEIADVMVDEAVEDLKQNTLGLSERLDDHMDGLSHDEMDALINRLREAIRR